MMKKFLCTAAMFTVLLGSVSFAESAAGQDKEKYEGIGSIPSVLLNRLQNARYEDQYVAEILSVIYQNTSDEISLTVADIERADQRETIRMRRQQIGNLIQYDLNFDGEINKQEIEEGFQLQRAGQGYELNPERISAQVKTLMKHDLDGDGKITYTEMAAIKNDMQRTRQTQRSGQLNDYMAFDENKNGSLSIEELRKAARKAFATIDADGNSIVSSEERAAVSRPLQAQREMRAFDKCAFKDLQMPADLAVYGAGAYAGKRLGKQIDDSGHDATSMKIVVNETKRPVALVLGAYEPTVWNIKFTKGTKIHAVMLSGYHQQVITGLPKDTPLLVSTFQNREKNPDCGYVYFSEDQVKKLNPLSRKLFNKPADMFYPARDGVAVIGTEVYNVADLIDMPEEPVAFTQKDEVLSGKMGLQAAIDKGLIRQANPSDNEAWLDALEKEKKKIPDFDVPPVAGKTVRDYLPRISISPDAYVVLKDFVYPSGLYGGHSAIFIIPKGVKRPSGDPGHSSVYDMNDLSCGGARSYSGDESWCKMSAPK